MSTGLTSVAPDSIAPTARLLDITRLLSRAGRGLTGVDRVELAYLDALLARDTLLFGLARTGLGFVLLDQNGLRDLRSRLSGDDLWGAPDLLSRVTSRASVQRKGAESALRKHAIARATRSGLARILRRHLPDGTVYLNTGHSNLHADVFAAVRCVANSRITVLIHDLIPLDFPDFQRDGTVETFRQKMSLAIGHANHLIFNSKDTADRAKAHFPQLPSHTVAHLGVDARALKASLKAEVQTTANPYFVALGTIEPRKNHGFLLDLWQELWGEMSPEDMPGLKIIGRRGWKNRDVFERLDAGDPDGAIEELNDLTDDQVFAALRGSCGLLMPSLAEGFGLPVLEAAWLNIPILANDLAVYREFLPNIPVYAPVNDRYLWLRTIKKMAAGHRVSQKREPMDEICLPSWEAHFNQVLKVT